MAPLTSALTTAQGKVQSGEQLSQKLLVQYKRIQTLGAVVNALGKGCGAIKRGVTAPVRGTRHLYRLATGSHDGLVRILDPRDGTLVLQLRGHTDYVHDLVFSPDGSVLASASGDHTIRLWHTRPVAETLAAAGR